MKPFSAIGFSLITLAHFAFIGSAASSLTNCDLLVDNGNSDVEEDGLYDPDTLGI